MSRLPLLLRAMHTGGRQIPHHATPSTSPTIHGNIPQNTPQPQSLESIASTSDLPPLTPSTPASSSSPSTSNKRYTNKGRLIPHRPKRTIPVTLPSGYPEPSTYPPTKDYFEMIRHRKADEIASGKEVKPHPLWKFFRVPDGVTKELDEGVTAPPDMGSLEVWASIEDNLARGRAWSAEELRTKSFQDLHALWYALIRERNILATQKEERRRLGIRLEEGGDIITLRALRCRKSMARIKYVLNERRLALLASTLPHLPKSSLPVIPSSLPGQNDPLAAVEALHGAPAPSLVKSSLTSTGAAADEQGSVADEMESVEKEGLVGKDEVESRDEGFGGGKEAEEFVRDVQVGEDGTVKKA